MSISLPVGSFSWRCIGHYSLEDGFEFANPPASKKQASLNAGAYPGGMRRMHVHPPSPPCASPPGHVHPPLPSLKGWL
jgi:hypothetical protein